MWNGTLEYYSKCKWICRHYNKHFFVCVNAKLKKPPRNIFPPSTPLEVNCIDENRDKVNFGIHEHMLITYLVHGLHEFNSEKYISQIMTIKSIVAKDWWGPSYSKIRRNILRIMASLTKPSKFHVRCRVSQTGNWYTGLVRFIIYDSCAIHILNRWVRTSIEGIQ